MAAGATDIRDKEPFSRSEQNKKERVIAHGPGFVGFSKILCREGARESTILVSGGSVYRKRSRTAGGCGWVRLSPRRAFKIIDGPRQGLPPD